MFESLCSRFSVPGRILSCGRFGSGLINDTYLCEYSLQVLVRKYILQRINTAVFIHPEEVMRNVELVTGHIQDRLRSEGIADPEMLTPALVLTKEGRTFHRDAQGGAWRMFHFIETGEVFDRVTGPEHAHEIGRALGRFQALVADLDPGLLYDTLPGFHHTPRYLAEFDDALRKGRAERAAESGREIAFVNNRRHLAPLLTEAMASRRIPLRVVHNDPKVNNIMIHRATGKALCMVDLDTVKSGIVHFDYGDCVRSAANPAGEDAADPAEARIDETLVEAITAGYLHEAAGFLTAAERDLLPASVLVITYELAVRFLADYLRGDTYFKIRHPRHNLLRARVQLSLLESMEASPLLGRAGAQ